ncbi:MAG: hypothetical protein JSC161_000261 [Candidatus Tokpelaia sp. JSC161]|jgi:hypothetical protein|nr:MAG: hypothetical protein JSC161_000261 [Candidatus Tokpelaia sp. JSC161]
MIKSNFYLYVLLLLSALFLENTDSFSTESTRIKNNVAVFSGLDKITGRVSIFEIHIGNPYKFGTLQIIPRVCYTSSQNTASLTNGFIEINEMTIKNKIKRIFTGWMFADSPGLNALEHPVYDVWLKSCKTQTF